VNKQNKKKNQLFYPQNRHIFFHSSGGAMHNSKPHQSMIITYIIVIFLFIFSLILITNLASATYSPALDIYLFDSEGSSWEPLTEPIFFEYHNYDIAVTMENNCTFAYNVTLTIGTQDVTYKTTNSMPFITITAPSYSSINNEFIITASKEGYETAIVSVTLLKGTLQMVTDRVTVQEDESFSVIVTDTTTEKIPDCQIYIDSVHSTSCTAITNKLGIAYLPAPSVNEDTQLTVIAVKEGYAASASQIRVENIQTAFIGDVSTEFQDILPVILAIISVILAILIVTIRNRHDYNIHKENIFQAKKSIIKPLKFNNNKNESKMPNRLQSDIQTPTISKYTPTLKQNGNLQPKSTPIYKKGDCRSSHIEEIRIHIQNHEKKSKNISIEDKIDQIIPRHKVNKYDWFNGKDDIRNKIDSLTGEVDEQKSDKWFEGIDEIRGKVDEKLKKNNRKKNDNT
jgi:hypothetical protein